MKMMTGSLSKWPTSSNGTDHNSSEEPDEDLQSIKKQLAELQEKLSKLT
jgi:hypothetical protein